MNETIQYVIKLRDRFSSGFGKLRKNLKNTSREIDKVNRKAKMMSTSLGGVAARLGGIFAAIGIAKGGSALVKLGSDMEQTRVAFATFLGDAEKANEVIAGLNKFSNVTPFDNASVIKAGRQLLAAQVDASVLEIHLKRIGDVAAGANVPLTDMASIYSKAMNKGRLQAEELNQLSERGIPIISELATHFGITSGAVLKMGEQGKLTSDVMVASFERMSSEGGMFFNMMEKQSTTLGGKWSTLIGKFQLMAVTISEKLLPHLTPLVNTFINFVDTLTNSRESMTKISDILIKIVEGFKQTIKGLESVIKWYMKYKNIINIVIGVVGTYLIVIEAISFATGLWTTAQWLLNAAMTANPIGLVVAGVAALVIGIAIAYKTFQGFRAMIAGVGSVFVQLGKNIMAVFTALNLLKNGRFKAAKAVFGTIGDLGEAYERGKNELINDEFNQDLKDKVKKKKENGSTGTTTTTTTTTNTLPSNLLPTSPVKDLSEEKNGTGGKGGISLNIENLINNLIINTSSMSDIEMEETITRVLLSSLNDVTRSI